LDFKQPLKGLSKVKTLGACRSLRLALGDLALSSAVAAVRRALMRKKSLSQKASNHMTFTSLDYIF
jgi:hypothetical protein